MTAPIYDVVVLGGGNAGLSAALTARELGARVALVEAAPRAFRGGNSRHTRNLRVAHDAPTAVLTDSYPADEFWSDLLRVSGSTDETLARLAIERSVGCPAWMARHGVRFQASLKLAELPRNSAPTRVRNRCEVTGRPRAYYRKHKLSRIALRELGNKGLIPGLVKSSW